MLEMEYPTETHSNDNVDMPAAIDLPQPAVPASSASQLKLELPLPPKASAQNPHHNHSQNPSEHSQTEGDRDFPGKTEKQRSDGEIEPLQEPGGGMLSEQILPTNEAVSLLTNMNNSRVRGPHSPQSAQANSSIHHSHQFPPQTNTNFQQHQSYNQNSSTYENTDYHHPQQHQMNQRNQPQVTFVPVVGNFPPAMAYMAVPVNVNQLYGHPQAGPAVLGVMRALEDGEGRPRKRKRKNRLCAVDGCTKNARGKTKFCVRHGGGARCSVPGCEKGARPHSTFCSAHGGGHRCLWPGCNKGALAKSVYCRRHGKMAAANSMNNNNANAPPNSAQTHSNQTQAVPQSPTQSSPGV